MTGYSGYDSGYDYVSAITGCTTEVRGRFAVRGPAFELLADGSVASGGPGRAPGPLDLLVSALVVNLLNVLRAGGDPGTGDQPDGQHDRVVQVRARTSRYPANRLKVGRLLVEVVVDGLSEQDSDALLERYRAGCRVLPAVSTVLDVDIRAVAPAGVAA
ncbi:hypothetical protein BLA60_29165 [Actinophytocola xinjiangensis]|uniref:OsmC-like protein n=1 Tax=Actinophytocola xinjiangensis TaxID=485602 RepID=A0A7Z0WGU6_9PSEU|nr:hypothetical protein [Actinophytocola xinjiangensis]OLF06936.1 hypothetical protein BLA60_29165 [Actinophytocola xinjiangensis]